MTTVVGKFASKAGLKKSKIHLLAEGLAPYAFAIFVGYCISDLIILGVRGTMLPKNAPPARAARPSIVDQINKGSYQSIISRNVFSSDGIIPEPLSSQLTKDGKRQQEDAPPVPSSLPLQLLGTLVHSNPAKSIATIDLKGKGMTIAFTPNRDIENMATVLKVERNKVVLRNLNNGRLEFIEIKTNSKVSFNSAAKPTPIAPSGRGEVKQVAPNQYKLSRATILKHTQDLSSLLMQASTVPHRKANGEIDGFTLTSFKPDSVFAELGVQQGDVIKAVNGEPVDSPAKAMELYNMLKTQNDIKLMVESDGRSIEKHYTIE